MSKHGAKGHVSDTLDTLNGGVKLIIDDNTAFGIHFNANLLEVEALGVGDTADSDENDVGFQLLNASASVEQRVQLNYLQSPLCHPWQPRS